jgi:hypothetical protein
MKSLRIVFVSGILTIAPLALATLPAPKGVLGKVEGALDFCAQTDQQSAEKYQQKKKALVKGASEKELAEARASQEYKDGNQSATDELLNEAKDDVKKSCSAALEAK